jgi:protease II
LIKSQIRHSGATGRFKELEDVALKFAYVLHLSGKDKSNL